MKNLKKILLVLTTFAATAGFSQPEAPDDFYLCTADVPATMQPEKDNFEANRRALRRTLLREEALRASERGEYDLAASLTDRLAEDFGGSADLFADAASAYILAGKQPEARLRFISGLKLDPDHLDCRLGLAKTLIALGDLEDVCHHLQQAVAAGHSEATELSDRYCPETEAEARGVYHGF